MRKRNNFMLLLSKLYIYSHKGFFSKFTFSSNFNVAMNKWPNDEKNLFDYDNENKKIYKKFDHTRSFTHYKLSASSKVVNTYPELHI